MNGNNNNSTTSKPQEKNVRDTAVAAYGAAGIELESDDDFSDEDDEDFSFIPTSTTRAAAAASAAAAAAASSIRGKGVGHFDSLENTSNRNFEGDWDNDDTNDDDQKVNAKTNDEISREFDKFLSDDDDDDDDDDDSCIDNEGKEGNDKKNDFFQQDTTNREHDRIRDNSSSNNASTKEIELLGQRARARYLKEELQKKQKEIQVVDYIPPKLQSQKMTQSDVISRKKPPPPEALAPQQYRTTAGTESSSTTRTNGKRSHQNHLDNSNPSSKKRRSTFSSLKPTQKNGSDCNGNGICWMPDISKIIQPHREKTSTIDEEEKVSQLPYQSQPSTWVVVHGLPHDSTPDDVRRFFLGLKPQMVCVLLSNNVCMEYLLDASNLHHYYEHERPENQKVPDSSSSLRKTRNFRQPHQPSLSTSPPSEELNDAPDITTARVIVKFRSSGIASLAEERSGETLSMARTPAELNTSSSTPRPSRRYYAIAVTQLDKFAAKHLVRNVAVDVKEIVFRNSPSFTNSEGDDDDDDSRKTNPKIYTFSDYVDIVVRHLPPLVLESLWTCVEQKYINYRLRDAKRKSLQRRDQNFIKLDDNIKNANLLIKFEDRPWTTRRDAKNVEFSSVDLTSLAGYQSLARHHNRIANIIEDMEEWMDNQNRGGNKSLSYCAVSLRLTEQAITGFLDQQLNRLDDLAFQARVARRIDMNRSKTT